MFEFYGEIYLKKIPIKQGFLYENIFLKMIFILNLFYIYIYIASLSF